MGLAYEVGQHVRLLADIWDDGQDHHPPGYLARSGEVLIVRAVDTGHEMPLCISHEHITDRSFRVALNEISLENIGKCHDCEKVRPLREFEGDNLAGTQAFLIEICQECYEERTK